MIALYLDQTDLKNIDRRGRIFCAAQTGVRLDFATEPGPL